MRTLRVYLLLLVLLGVSLGAGFFAADWPSLCARAHWCAPGWPRAQLGAPGAPGAPGAATAVAPSPYQALRPAIVHAVAPPSARP